jgi:polysaccharide export outer membrane protein
MRKAHFLKFLFSSLVLIGLQPAILQAQQKGLEIQVSGDTIQTPRSSGNALSGGNRVFPAQGDTSPIESSGTTADDYLIGPGDTFIVSFWGQIDDVLSIRVDDQNKVFIPRLGAMDVKGLNFGQFQEKLSKKIQGSLRNVSFTISLQSPRKFPVYVLGAVKTPGPIFATAQQRVSELVVQAGGLEARASRQYIELRRRGDTEMVDLLKFYAFGDFSQNPLVTNGDVVYVPAVADFVTVSGAIAQPGIFEIRETRSLADVVRDLGGPAHYADKAKPIRVSRATPKGREILTVSWASLASLEGAEKDSAPFEVVKGDEIFVPSALILIPSQSDSVFVTGEVRAPGARPFQNSMTVDEYIGSAGGVTNRANMRDSKVFRKDGSIVALNSRLAIEPGDTIFIAEKTFKFWEDHVMILTTLLTLATTIITVSK